jgi:VWFA-related protein
MNRRHFLSLASAAAYAQEPSQVITMDVRRVNLLFTVSDKRGRFVNNLNKDSFEIFENRRQQNILEFVAETDMPLRIGVLVDTSNSIRERFRFELEAAADFLKSVIRPDRDKALIYSYDTEPALLQAFTPDTDLLTKRLRSIRPGGSTSLFETIYVACRDRMATDTPRHKYRRAIILIGDGDDNSSTYTRDQALEMLNNAEVVVYAISTNMTRAETGGDRVLKYFCDETGGRAFFPFKAEDMAQDFENIANELRSQYSILYRPEPEVTDGTFRSVKVQVKRRKDVVVRARKGYYAKKT